MLTLQETMNRAQQSLAQTTSVGRLIDLRYPTNVVILVVSALAGGMSMLLTLAQGEGGTLRGLFEIGVNSAGAVFLAWALAREFDPDHAWQAFIGTGLALIAALFAPPASLWSLGALLVLSRVVNRIVGPPARFVDSVVALAFSAGAIAAGWWVFGLVAAAAFVLDALLPKPNRRHWAFAAASLAIMFAAILINAAAKPFAPSTWTLPALVAAGAVAYIIAVTQTKSSCDMPEYPLDNRRLQAAMGLMLFAGVLYVLWAGTAGLIALLPLWAIMIGATVWRLWEMMAAN